MGRLEIRLLGGFEVRRDDTVLKGFESQKFLLSSDPPDGWFRVDGWDSAFVIFDVEAIFFYPWGALLSELGWQGYWVMLIFTVPLVVGLLYEWMKGALEW